MKPWNLLALIGLAAALTFISPPTSTFRTAVSAATTWGDPRTLVSIGTQTPIGTIVDIATERHRINSAGHVAFAATVNSDSQQRQAILLLKDDVFTKVVAQGDVLDGKTVQYLGCAFGFNDSDELVFEAYGDDWEPTIYFWNGSSASPILRIGDPTPLGGAYHNDFSCTSGAVRPTLNLNNSGQVLFASHVSGGSSTAAIFLWASGTVTTVAAIGDSRPDGGTFTNLYLSDPHQNSLTNDGRIVFIDFGPGSSADNGRMYEWKSGVSQLIGTGDSVPDVGSTVRSVCPYYDLAAHAAGRRLALGLTYRVGTIESDGVFAYSNETLSKIALTGDTMPDGEAFDQTGSGDTCHHPAINSSGTVAFLGGRSVLTPGSKLFASGGGEVMLLDSDRSVFAPDINDNNQVLYLYAPSMEVSELRLVQPHQEPHSLEKRAIVYVQGILSESTCVITNDLPEGGAGFLDRAPGWLNPYLASNEEVQSTVEITRTVYFSYSGSYCGGANGSDGAAPAYGRLDTCSSGIDEDYSRMLAALIEEATNDGSKATIIAHSQGGLISSYTVGRLIDEDPEFVENRIASVVTFDSFPGGLPAGAIGSLLLWFGATSECNVASPSIFDWSNQRDVGQVASASARSFGPNGYRVKFYTLDAGGPPIPEEFTNIRGEVLHVHKRLDDHSTIWDLPDVISNDPTDISKEAMIGCALIAAECCDLLPTTCVDLTPEQCNSELGLGCTYITIPVPEGSKIIPVQNNSDFAPGNTISINPNGSNQETRQILELGSLVVSEPLQFQHHAGEPVYVRGETPKPTAVPSPATSTPTTDTGPPRPSLTGTPTISVNIPEVAMQFNPSSGGLAPSHSAGSPPPTPQTPVPTSVIRPPSTGSAGLCR